MMLFGRLVVLVGWLALCPWTGNAQQNKNFLAEILAVPGVCGETNQEGTLTNRSYNKTIRVEVVKVTRIHSLKNGIMSLKNSKPILLNDIAARETVSLGCTGCKLQGDTKECVDYRVHRVEIVSVDH
jgi:hypothetical protein